ncbi:2-oxo-4-hydroxy-4-carboxy-5-ureidoimidazoline decarboxylase [Peribacillus asahii]|uniref:2-oxo-4-hydroxy-4-carboxy-5-ureidoimidazoline decarboxylase n=1 Tax=Peribacillus asahii TaxID=228899 RepID=A0A3Q9RKQ8_9BACI|nr:2-oxo-4-hydroxy-4-carboxy-5-ureidoimidazoline decarboxylase [Peribacillus asahii]AZV41470.1 OHCU decarboxylase [Peribacillus asahii]USK85871.1 2-oxo-4-hydroxy-4-carboxy-5-ureidoimidazoline decarboxylase [Peribacillus asahii]
MLTLETVNQTSQEEFVQLFGDLFEHSAWIAKKVYDAKPFSSFQEMHQHMVSIVKNASTEEKLTLIQAHPNLGDKVQMSQDSINEQQGAGLQNLTPAEYENFLTLNQNYQSKFGFPFIIAVRGKDKHQIYEAMNIRIDNPTEVEFETALLQIYQISKLRLLKKTTMKNEAAAANNNLTNKERL